MERKEGRITDGKHAEDCISPSDAIIMVKVPLTTCTCQLCLRFYQSVTVEVVVSLCLAYYMFAVNAEGCHARTKSSDYAVSDGHVHKHSGHAESQAGEVANLRCWHTRGVLTKEQILLSLFLLELRRKLKSEKTQFQETENLACRLQHCWGMPSHKQDRHSHAAIFISAGLCHTYSLSVE